MRADPALCDVGRNSDICCGSCAQIDAELGSAVIDRSVKHSVETRVVVDKFAFDRWKATVHPSLSEARKKTETEKALREYIKAVFTGTNAIYGTLLSAGINLDLRVASVEYASSETVANEISPGSGTGETTSMLDDLEEWLDAKNLNYPTVDHTVLFTGLDVGKQGNFDVAGVAKTGAICSTNSLSVVEAEFSGASIFTLAHEMGHSLNSAHDGEGNNCHEDSKNVMDAHSGKDHNDTKNFRFSECSADYIKNKLKLLQSATGGNCLSAANTRTAPTSSVPLGKLYSPDEMCRRQVGPGSHVHRSKYGVGGDLDYHTICRAVWCSSGPRTLRSIPGADGFPCGKDKECSLGFCKASGRTNSLSDKCPLGDTPSDAHVSATGKTCGELVTSAYAGSCYNGFVSRACCKRCETFKTTATERGRMLWILCLTQGHFAASSSINLVVAQSSISSAILTDSRDHPTVDWSLNARLATSG
nr:hypothetical protein BaRGS_002979 [Batillaria attramentaria]